MSRERLRYAGRPLRHEDTLFYVLLMRIISIFACLFCGMLLQAQTRYVSPIDFTVSLAGNFGEPRPNHFHCGLDFRTQGAIGKKIYSVADGYISRATVGLNGFGNALYVTHPDGNTSVYCHLDRFLPEVRQQVFAKQCERESETVDVRFTPEQFPVKAGQQIAFSGNTGASAGPHLHLELHRTADGALLNPMPYFKYLVTDRIAPRVRGIRIYPKPGEGVVSGSLNPVSFAPGSTARTFQAWGKIGFAFWADDYMNGTNNKFGIYKVSLLVDGRQVYISQMDSLMPTDHRKINSWGDYEWYLRQRCWYLKGFADPGNDLALLQTDANRGWVLIDSMRTYKVEYRLTDEFGNTTVTRFNIEGTPYEQLLAEAAQKEAEKRKEHFFLAWNEPHVVQLPGMELRLPLGLLFHDVVLKPTVKPATGKLSYKYHLHDEALPLRANATLMIALSEPVAHPEKCYIESRKGYVGGKYKDGWVSASIRNLDEDYALAIDTVAPVIRSLGRQGRRFRVTCRDGKSGVRSMKAYVDGRFVLFTGRDVRTCDLVQNGLRAENRSHTLVLVGEDRCGNVARDTLRFTY